MQTWLSKWRRPIALSALLTAMLFPTANAQTLPQLLNISGGLFNSNGTPITSNSVSFKLEVLDKNSVCVLYVEEHLGENLSTSKGAFSLLLGNGTSPSNKLQGGTTFGNGLFINSGPTGAFADCPTGVTLAPGEERQIRVSYNLGAGFIAMTPNVPIVSSAFAMVADTIQGKALVDLVQTNSSSAVLTQSNVETIFSNVNYPKLTALLDGTSTQYLPTTPTIPVDLNGQRLVNIANPSNPQDAATKNYVDGNLGGKTVDVTGVSLGVGGGKTLIWNQVLNKWEAQDPSSYVGGVVAGSGLLGGTISSYGTLSVDTGTTANKIIRLDSSAYLPAVDGHLLTNLVHPVLSVNGKLGVVNLIPSDIVGLGTAATRNVGYNAGEVLAFLTNNQLPALDASLLTNINATLLQSRAVGNVVPSSGQVLTWNNSAAQWEPQNAVINGITDLTGDMTAVGPGSAVATIGTNKITTSKINNTGNVANRLLMTDNTTGATVVYAVCLDGEVMKYSTATGWGCAVDAGAAGVVTLVAAGTGLVAGTISSVGTLSVDVGVTGSKILQLTPGAQVPAVDGNLLTNVNAVKLQARNVAATAPTADQVLRWNNSTSVWEPSNATTGTVTQIVASTGLLGGTISATGTVSVDVGVSANKIVQLTAGAQYPAVDGNLIANINAVKIQGRDISSTAPSSSQVLGWNSTTSVWEPISAAVGSMTGVVSGTGLVPSTISSFGTLNVDVGVTANKVLQLNGSAQIPAVDGNLVTNVNAVKLQARNVASTAPGAGQFLGYNATTSAWEPMTGNSGSLTGVVSGTGLVAGTVSSYGTINIDVGSTANKIVQLTSGAQYPQADGYLITNINAGSISGVGTVTSVNSGAGLLGGPFSTIGTLSVDVGTAANKILQLNGSAQIPAVDGNLVTNVNAVKLQTRNVAATAPTADQVLRWNNSTSAWEPSNASTGTVTQIVASTGLLGGTISATGTVSVDVGVSANKIVQLTAGAQYPAVDGNLITNVNAVKLQARDVAGTAPGDGQVLTWNNATLAWEPKAPGAGADNLGNHTASQNLAMTNFSVVGLNLGTAGAPSVSFNSDATTGVFSPAASTVAVSTGGSERLRVTSTGALGVGTNTPARRLHVSGTDGMRLDPTALPGSPAAGDIAIDSGASNTLKYYNGSAWVSSSGGTMTGVVSGTGLIASTITSYGTINIDVGSTANKIVQLTAGAQYPQADGYLITNLNAGSISGVGTVTSVNSGTGLLGGPFSTVGTLSVDVGTAANKILQLNGSAQIPAVDGNLITNVNAVKLQNRNVASTAPGAGQFLGYNATTSAWEPMTGSAGSLTGVVSGTGLIAGTISSYGTINIDVGSTANKIVQLTAGAQYPQADGNLISNINAVKLQARNVAGTAPGDGQVLTWNNSSLVWEPKAPGAGADNLGNHTASQNLAMTNFSVVGLNLGTAGAPSVSFNSDATTGVFSPAASTVAVSTGGSERLRVTSTGALGVGTNTPARRLHVSGTDGMRLDPTALPGSPAAGDIAIDSGASNTLKYYNGSAWVSSSGTMTGVVSGTGLVASTISSYGTINVDVGTTANKILQLNGSAQIPAVDGNLITNVNAVKLQARNVANTAPGAGQFLGYNATTSAWEPMTGSAGSLTGVVSGTGLIAGTISSYGTINIDVGSTANKIVQLTASAQYPQADGHLISNLNVVSLRGRSIASTTPTANQVLTWNGSQWQASDVTAAANAFVNGGNSFGATATLGTNDLANLNVVTNGATRLTVTALGSVGIGTTSPNALLSIYQSINAWQGLEINNPNAGTNASADILMYNDQGSNAYIDVGVASSTYSANAGVWANRAYAVSGPTTNGVVYGTQGVDPSIFITNNVEVARIDSSGKMGIGTTTPQAILDVRGTGTLQSAMIVPRDTTALRPTGVNGMIRYNSQTNKMETFENGSWTNFATGAVGTGDFMANGSVPMTGNFNAVAGSAALPGIAFAGDTDTGMFEPGANTLGFSTGGTQRMTIDSLGNVGIGTTAPDATLSFSGQRAQTVNLVRQQTAATAGSSLTVKAGGAFSSGTDLNGGTLTLSGGTSTGGGVSTVQLLVANGNGGTGSGDNTPSAGLVVTGINNGFSTIVAVGIGTSNPESGKIHMVGNSTNWAGQAGLRLDDTYHGTLSRNWEVANSSGASVGELNFSYGTAYGNSPSYVDGSAAKHAMSLYRNGGMAIGAYAGTATNPPADGLMVSGRVGVGTNSPQAILDVYGTGTGQSAMIVPRDTTGNRPIGVNGMIRYNSQTNKMETFENGSWTNFATGAAGAGDFMASGSVPMTGNFNAVAGSAALPGVAFVGDTDTGLYRIAANELGVSAGGSLKLTVKAAGIELPNSADVIMMRSSAPLLNGSLASSQSTPAYSFNGDTDTGVFSPGANIYAISTAAIERMRVDSNGFVAIGTTTPQAILDVRGTGTLQSAMIVPRDTTALRPGGVNGMIRYNTNTNRLEGFENGMWGNISVASAGIAASGTAGAIQYSSGTGAFASNNNLVIDGTNGRVGIGTATPATSLDVRDGTIQSKGTTTPIMSIREDAGNSAQEVIRLRRSRSDATAPGLGMVGVAGFELEGFTNSSTAKAAAISFGWESAQTNDTTDRDSYISFRTMENFGNDSTWGDERMRISSSGKVGIGTTAPTSRLEIVDSGSIVAILWDQIIRNPGNNSSTEYGTGIKLKNSDDTGNEVNKWVGVAATAGTNWSNRTDLVIYGTSDATSAPTEKMRVTGAGNVGIGTTTPQAILDVRGTGTLQSAMIVPRDTTALRPTGVNGMIRYNSQTNKMETFENGSWTNFTTGAAGAGDFMASGSVPMTGNFNAVSGSATLPGISFVGDTGTGFYRPAASQIGMAVGGQKIFAANLQGWHDISFGTGPAYPSYDFNINSTTNWGGNNGAVLAVASDRGALLSGADDVMLIGQNLMWDPQYSHLRSSATTAAAGYGGMRAQNGQIDFFTGSGATANYTSISPTPRLTISTDGFVGIGTTTPQAILDVRGTGTLQSAMIVPRDTTALRPTGVNGMIRYNTSTSKLEAFENNAWNNVITTATTFPLLASPVGTAAAPAYSFTGDTNTGMFDVGVGTLGFATAGSTRLVIDSVGKVGIGTTTPRSDLDVNGVISGKPSVVNATSTVDFGTGNIQYTNSSCGAFILHNMKDGTSYTFAVKGTAMATCSFTAFSGAGTGALSVRLPPDHSATTASTMTVYTMLVIGGDVFISWIPGW